MADNTPIEWADATVNAINGCSLASPGCTNCYAMKQAHRFPIRQGLTMPSKGGMVWTGKVRFAEEQLLKPLAWKRPRRIFWNAHGDTFHDAVPDEWIDRVFAVCALTPQHTHMILTKRSARMREYLTSGRSLFVWRETRNLGLPELQRAKRLDSHVRRQVFMPLPNVWLGVSIEDQTRADERIPDLLATPAAKRFISAEPLLGPIDLGCIQPEWFTSAHGWLNIDIVDALNGRGLRLDEEDEVREVVEVPKLDWVIAGGESGPGARPMHPDWARSLRDQCAEAGVPFHFKQWGDWTSVYDRDRDDPQWNNVPKPGDWDRKRWLNLAGGQGFHGEKLNMMKRVGKKAAGRLLDGIEHNGVPA